MLTFKPSQKHYSQTIFSFVAHSNRRHSSATPISELDVTKLQCPALQEVERKKGEFDIMYWEVCTSKSCDHKDTTWDRIASMSNTRITHVERERFNITRDGALEIHPVNPSDTGQYMCTVKKTDHSSPGIYHTSLVVIQDGKLNCASSSWLVCPLNSSHRVARIQVVQTGTYLR